MHRIVLIPLILVFLMLAGCARTQTWRERMENARTFVYEDGDGYRFVARAQGERVWLFLPGETLLLPQVVAASGAKYSSPLRVRADIQSAEAPKRHACPSSISTHAKSP